MAELPPSDSRLGVIWFKSRLGMDKSQTFRDSSQPFCANDSTAWYVSSTFVTPLSRTATAVGRRTPPRIPHTIHTHTHTHVSRLICLGDSKSPHFSTLLHAVFYVFSTYKLYEIYVLNSIHSNSKRFFYARPYLSMWAPVVARQISKRYWSSCHVFISMWGVISLTA